MKRTIMTAVMGLVAALGLYFAGAAPSSAGVPESCGCVDCRCPDCNGEVCTCDNCECGDCACAK